MAGQELNVLAVAILGGASLVGGVGSMGGVVLGVLFLAMLQNGLNLLGVSSYFFGVVIGLAILVSISHDRLRREARAAGAAGARLMHDATPDVDARAAASTRSSTGCSPALRGTARERRRPARPARWRWSRFFSLLMPATFPRLTTLQAMMFQLPELGLLSLAMAIPLISGGINLAIIATANQAGLLMAWILTALMPPDASGAALALWLAGALAAGLAALHRRRPGHRPAGRGRSACIRSW